MIWDAVDGDLPLDSNRLITGKRQMIYLSPGGVLLKSPVEIGALRAIVEAERGRRAAEKPALES